MEIAKMRFSTEEKVQNFLGFLATKSHPVKQYMSQDVKQFCNQNKLPYFMISLLIEKGILLKIARGVYRINVFEPTKELINIFSDLIKEKNAIYRKESRNREKLVTPSIAINLLHSQINALFSKVGFMKFDKEDIRSTIVFKAPLTFSKFICVAVEVGLIRKKERTFVFLLNPTDNRAIVKDVYMKIIDNSIPICTEALSEEACIEFLKERGYKILKPVTDFKEV